jgi:hypothetical protein
MLDLAGVLAGGSPDFDARVWEVPIKDVRGMWSLLRPFSTASKPARTSRSFELLEMAPALGTARMPRLGDFPPRSDVVLGSSDGIPPDSFDFCGFPVEVSCSLLFWGICVSKLRPGATWSGASVPALGSML